MCPLAPSHGFTLLKGKLICGRCTFTSVSGLKVHLPKPRFWTVGKISLQLLASVSPLISWSISGDFPHDVQDTSHKGLVLRGTPNYKMQ